MQPEEKAEIAQRLRTANGHLNAVIGMVEAGEPCESILHQLSAVRATLHAVGIKLLTCQLKLSLDIVCYSPRVADREAAISQLLILYRLLPRYFDYTGRE